MNKASSVASIMYSGQCCLITDMQLSRRVKAVPYTSDRDRNAHLRNLICLRYRAHHAQTKRCKRSSRCSPGVKRRSNDSDIRGTSSWQGLSLRSSHWRKKRLSLKVRLVIEQPEQNSNRRSHLALSFHCSDLRANAYRQRRICTRNDLDQVSQIRIARGHSYL